MAVLAPLSRLYTCDVAVMSVVKAGIEGSPFNILGLFADCRLSANAERADAFLPHDINDSAIRGFTLSRTKRVGWSVELGTLLEKTADPFVLLQLAMALQSGGVEAIDTGKVVVNIYKPGGATDAAVYTGTGYITSAEFEVTMESVIMQRGTITGYGALS